MSRGTNPLPPNLLERTNYLDSRADYRLREFRAFWDSSLKLWTVTRHDYEGNQVGDAEYFPNRDAYRHAAWKQRRDETWKTAKDLGLNMAQAKSMHLTNYQLVIAYDALRKQARRIHGDKDKRRELELIADYLEGRWKASF